MRKRSQSRVKKIAVELLAKPTAYWPWVPGEMEGVPPMLTSSHASSDVRNGSKAEKLALSICCPVLAR
jgi:hypothetical protein